MAQAEQIEHKGTVLSIEQGVVRVAIEVNEACGSCASRKACAMGQGTTREIVVCTDDAERYSVGEKVNVMARQSAGVMAVILCYVVPLVVLVTALAVAIALGCNEGVSAFIALGFTAIYYVILATFRKRISKRVIFSINKI
ncbi:MAG: Fis family transcriptional regulator [Rikenellaceae bacterium]|nr:Fis family transcriptional regulator [Rikenellaceae bacterium]